MNVPMEHFSSVPVVLLSPSIMCTPEEEVKESLAKGLMGKLGGEGLSNQESVSNKASPEYSRPGSSMESSVISDPGSIGKFRTKAVAVGKFFIHLFINII